MIRRRNVVICTVGMALIFVLAMGSACMDERASEAIAAGGSVPIFEVDPLWPKPLPNHWILGSTIGVSVDSRDHIWIIHRQTTFNEANELGATLNPPTTECCVPAPNILEFDMEGNLVNSWGGARRRLRLAAIEPRHHGRRHGQCVDRRQRRGRLAHPEVHSGRAIPHAARPASHARGQQ